MGNLHGLTRAEGERQGGANPQEFIGEGVLGKGNIAGIRQGKAIEDGCVALDGDLMRTRAPVAVRADRLADVDANGWHKLIIAQVRLQTHGSYVALRVL